MFHSSSTYLLLLLLLRVCVNVWMCVAKTTTRRNETKNKTKNNKSKMYHSGWISTKFTSICTFKQSCTPRISINCVKSISICVQHLAEKKNFSIENTSRICRFIHAQNVCKWKMDLTVSLAFSLVSDIRILVCNFFLYLSVARCLTLSFTPLSYQLVGSSIDEN